MGVRIGRECLHSEEISRVQVGQRHPKAVEAALREEGGQKPGKTGRGTIFSPFRSLFVDTPISMKNSSSLWEGKTHLIRVNNQMIFRICMHRITVVYIPGFLAANESIDWDTKIQKFRYLKELNTKYIIIKSDVDDTRVNWVHNNDSSRRWAEYGIPRITLLHFMTSIYLNPNASSPIAENAPNGLQATCPLSGEDLFHHRRGSVKFLDYRLGHCKIHFRDDDGRIGRAALRLTRLLSTICLCYGASDI
ncbi:hypothetical protein HYFRA_00010182 [Hymenoscyphus fraxineus]|uniref:Uncharacterized protein n=1 Tax=Hymenoscyphus fraxineus TaxID=746836 RepID=A0A9N9KV36_9HELO|nr:hypothetical protein HYFRA_00010182 [Hymenoscyphus fraxineus]